MYFLVVLIAICMATGGATEASLREDVYRVRCPERALSVYVERDQYDVGDVKGKVQCVALCQRDPACSSVTWEDKRCSLFTGREKKCEDRVPGKGGLERMKSNWCSNNGDLQSPDVCTCPQNYTDAFCTIGKKKRC